MTMNNWQQRALGSLLTSAALIVCFEFPQPAAAHVVRIVIESTAPKEPVKAGAPAYEVLRGHFFGELDPADPHNKIITDLKYASRNEQGRVEYSATFEIAKPVDMKAASGVLYYDVPNRGRGMAVPDEDGHIRVVSGWQGDIAPHNSLQTATVPLALGQKGPLLVRFTNMSADKKSLPIVSGFVKGVSRSLAVSLDTKRAHLYKQAADDQPLMEIAARDWSFGDCEAMPFPGKPDPTRLCVRGGFDPAYAYNLVYEAKDPQILGIGFAATRDFVSFLHHAAKDSNDAPNPIAGAVRWTVASGTSQSGNFLRSFVNLGFNGDEAGRIVFDGINPNIAARHVPLNMRFGLPGGVANLYEAGSDGKLWWASYDDQARGRGPGSLLDHCRMSDTCPKIAETFGSAEFWALRMSPDLVGTDAKRDIPLPDNVRRYYFPSVTHGGSHRGGFLPTGEVLTSCLLRGNANSSSENLRAIQKALVAWVKDGKEPPPSRCPTLAAGDLVEPTSTAMGWPAIPGAPLPDGKINPLLDYDFGQHFNYQDVSGVATIQPPKIRQVLPSRVPRVNADGNETAGIPSVQLLVPLGTYTGWNVLTKGYGKDGSCGLVGGFIPFAPTAAVREASGDPRLSLEERYTNHEGFVARVKEVAAQQVAEGWLLPDDAAKLIQQAESSAVLQ